MKRALGLAVIIAFALTGCWWSVPEHELDQELEQWTNETFYELPADLPAGTPGEVIRSMPIPSAPTGTQGWRVLYHSTDMAGADIAVSGVVVVPDLPAPAGGRVVVSWAHPTTGSAQQCAPSLESNPFFAIEGLDALLLAGYAVAATDYPGLGLPGPSSYLLGVTEGNSVLDMARAAKALDGTDIGERLLLWGHSQGGQAALFAAQQARDYAPEFTLEGVAVAAPAADLNALMSDDIINISGVTIASLAVPAFEAAYADTYSEADMASILTPEGAAATPSMAALCLITQNKEIHAIADPLVGNYVTADPSTTEPWATMLKENSAGGSKIGVPIYVGQGLDDKLVIPTATEGYVSRLCADGETVMFEKFDGVTHALAAFASVPTLVGWYEGVLAGDVESNCP